MRGVAPIDAIGLLAYQQGVLLRMYGFAEVCPLGGTNACAVAVSTMDQPMGSAIVPGT
jgi:hypothetical protein